MALRSLVGGAIFAEVSGSGWPLVVALHGWRRDRADMAAATEGLAGTVARLDLPGHGASPEPPEPWGSPDLAHRVGMAIDELLAELNEPIADESDLPAEGTQAGEPGPPDGGPASGGDGLGAGTAVVVGHSLGGRVAVCLAAQRPELVRGLVLAGVPLLRKPPGKPKLAFRLVRRLHGRGLISDARMEAWRQRYGSADYVAAHGVMRQVLVRVVAESYEEQLALLECPVALVWGELDTAAPLDMARRGAGLILTPHTFDVAEGVGHDVHIERPELLRTRIVELAQAASA